MKLPSYLYAIAVGLMLSGCSSVTPIAPPSLTYPAVCMKDCSDPPPMCPPQDDLCRKMLEIQLMLDFGTCRDEKRECRKLLERRRTLESGQE